MTITYQQSGVDIAAGNRLVDRIKKIAPSTHSPQVLGGIGGFGALFELPMHQYKNPLLVSTTDGVGTKLKLALQLNQYEGIGIDLVAMCVNDLIVCGAQPLFFLDYYATGHLDVDVAEKIIQSIADGCRQAGCALVGGETAEMPGMYHEKDFDLAGFSVGIVEKNRLIDGSKVKSGDVLIGLASSGLHSNGYSLARKILEVHQIDLDSMPFISSASHTSGGGEGTDKTLGEILITPTRIYVKSVLALYSQVDVHAAAHITGGGLIENLPRVLPNFTKAVLNLLPSSQTIFPQAEEESLKESKSGWVVPQIFTWLQKKSEISEFELLKTFNCGIGFVVCVASHDVEKTLITLKNAGEEAMIIGRIEESDEQASSVIFA